MSQQPLRVGLVLSGSECYGVGTIVESLATALDRDRIRLCGLFLEPVGPGNAFVKLMDEVYELNVGFIRGLHPFCGTAPSARSDAAWIVRTAARLARYVRRQRLDVLDVHDYHISLPAGLAARVSGVPCVRHCHAVHSPRAGLGLLAARAGASLVNRFVCVSRYMQGMLPTFMRKKSVVIHNGLDTETLMKTQRPGALRRMLNISAFAPIVAMSGRLTPLKGHEVLLQAAPHVLARFPDTRFVLIGSEVDIHGTSFVDHLKTTTTHLSLDSRVVFAGELQDAAKFNCDCDVSCSLTRPFGDAPLGEAFGLAVLEAMIAGVPVVGTSFGATPELISPGINGLLVPPNEPRAVAEALIALLEDGPRRKRMGEQGRRIAQEHFDIRQTARATEELWQLVCRGRKAPEKGPS